VRERDAFAVLGRIVGLGEIAAEDVALRGTQETRNDEIPA